MGALHSMRARAASSPMVASRRAMTSSWTGCIISLVPGARGRSTQEEIIAAAATEGRGETTSGDLVEE
eukprot:300458-Prymnesium_polylepis.1